LKSPASSRPNIKKGSGSSIDVFSDEAPDLSAGLTFTATYVWDDTDDDTKYTTVPPSTVPSGKYGSATRTIYPKRLVYPPVALPPTVAKDASPKAVAYIGLNYVNTSGTNNYWKYSDLETAYSSGINAKKIDIPITYWQVYGVELKSLPTGTFLYDDQTEYGDANKDRADVRSKIKTLLAGAEFNIYYVGPGNIAAPAEVSPRVINWSDFQKNVTYALGVANWDEYADEWMIPGTDKTRIPAATARDQTVILDYNEDEGDPVWGIDVQYVPKEYALSGAPITNSYTAKVTGLNIPVYLFNQEIGVSRKLYPSVEVNARATWQAAPATFPARLENGINDRWTLTASYIRGSDPKTKTIAGFQSAWLAGYRTRPEPRLSTAAILT